MGKGGGWGRKPGPQGPRIGKRERWVQPERPHNSVAELTALTVEARRRGITYGQLAERIGEAERREIVTAYLTEKRQGE